jgi:hypothetical protein
MNIYSYVNPTIVFEQTVQAFALMNQNYQLLIIHDKCNLVWWASAVVQFPIEKAFWKKLRVWKEPNMNFRCRSGVIYGVGSAHGHCPRSQKMKKGGCKNTHNFGPTWGQLPIF